MAHGQYISNHYQILVFKMLELLDKNMYSIYRGRGIYANAKVFLFVLQLSDTLDNPGA